MIEDKNLRIRVGDQAFQDTYEQYHPAKRAFQLAKTLNEIYLSIRGQDLFVDQLPTEQDLRESSIKSKGDPWVPIQFERDPGYIQLGVHMLRNRGFTNLLLSVWVYIRRLLAPVFPFSKNSYSKHDRY